LLSRRGNGITSDADPPRKNILNSHHFFSTRHLICRILNDCELTPPKCPGIAVTQGAASRKQVQGRRGGESESLEEEAIEIGNS
jgi:hypothetical protein